MRPIDWSPLVAFFSALVAGLLSDLIPDSLGLNRATAAIIIWVPLVLITLRAIRVIRIRRWRKLQKKSEPGEIVIDIDKIAQD
jgi:hypothetical protein